MRQIYGWRSCASLKLRKWWPHAATKLVRLLAPPLR
jgi:hypothetical protein